MPLQYSLVYSLQGRFGRQQNYRSEIRPYLRLLLTQIKRTKKSARLDKTFHLWQRY